MANLDVVDVSHHNGAIPWNRFRDLGVRGGICKVSDGYFMPPTYRTHIDPQFERNWQALDTFDLRGAYVFIRFDSNKSGGMTPKDQVKLAVDTIGDHKDTDIFALDVEQPAGQIAHISKAARVTMLVDALLEAEKGFSKVWIYTGAWWYDKQMPFPNSYITSFPMWMAYYGRFFSRNIPRGWTNPIAWQYKIGKIDGKSIDHNDFLWDWDDYLIPEPPFPPPVPPPPDPPPAEPPIEPAPEALIPRCPSISHRGVSALFYHLG